MNKGAWMVLCCYCLWGLLPVYWKLLANISSIYTLASRIFWSFVVCGILILYQKKYKKILVTFRDKKQLLLHAGCGIMVTINWGTYIYAVISGQMLEGSLAYFLNPIFSVLLGALIFSEKISKLKWLAVVLAFVGIMIQVLEYGKVPYLAIIIGLSFGIYGVMKKKVTTDGESSIFMETLFVVPISVVVLIYMELHHIGAATNLQGFEYLLLPGAGIITTIPLLLFAKGIKETTMSLSGILMYANPTLQMLLGILIYKESFSFHLFITFLFVWFGLALFMISNYREAKKT